MANTFIDIPAVVLAELRLALEPRGETRRERKWRKRRLAAHRRRFGRWL